MKIIVDYVRGFPNMKIINAETGEEVGVVVAKASLPEDQKVDLLETVSCLLDGGE